MIPFAKGDRLQHARLTFGRLAELVLSLDAAIEWVALEQAGHEPRWAWRDPESGTVYAGAAAANLNVVDPLLLMLAEGDCDRSGGDANARPYRLLFVVLAYAEMVQIVARFGADAHLSVAVSPQVDAYALGSRLTSLLERHTGRPRRH
jgi:hypothetical protein